MVRLPLGRESEYEARSAHALGARHAVAFGFARHALVAAMAGAGLERGDEVILSPLTCRVVPLALLWAGFKPVYVDIAAGTLNIDAERLAEVIRPVTRAVLFQHTYGYDGGLEAVSTVAQRHGCLLVEDCAQCLPISDARYAPGRRGRAAVFSNNLLKPLPAGSGGLLTTDDQQLAARVRETRDRLPAPGWRRAVGRNVEAMAYRLLVGPRSYWPVLAAYQRLSGNSRERPIAEEIEDQVSRVAYKPAAGQHRAGLRWLERLEAVAAHRRTCCADYQAALEPDGAWPDAPPRFEGRPLLYFPILTARKARLVTAAQARRLQVVAWPGSTPMYPVERLETLRAYGYMPGSCPVAESVAGRLLGLPTELNITRELRHRLIALVKAHAES